MVKVIIANNAFKNILKLLFISYFLLIFNNSPIYAYMRGYSNVFATADFYFPGNVIENTNLKQQKSAPNYGLSGGYLYSYTNRLRLGGSLSLTNGSSLTLKGKGIEDAKISTSLIIATNAEYDFYQSKKKAFFTYIGLGYGLKNIQYIQNSTPDLTPDAGTYVWQGTALPAGVTDAESLCMQELYNNPKLLLDPSAKNKPLTTSSVLDIIWYGSGSDTTTSTPHTKCRGFIDGYIQDVDNPKAITKIKVGVKESTTLKTKLIERKEAAISSLVYSVGLGYRQYFNPQSDFVIKVGYYSSLAVKHGSYAKIYNNSLQISTGFSYKFY